MIKSVEQKIKESVEVLMLKIANDKIIGIFYVFYNLSDNWGCVSFTPFLWQGGEEMLVSFT